MKSKKVVILATSILLIISIGVYSQFLNEIDKKTLGSTIVKNRHIIHISNNLKCPKKIFSYE